MGMPGACLSALLASQVGVVAGSYDIRLPVSFLNPPSGTFTVAGYVIDTLTAEQDAHRRWQGQQRLRVMGARHIYEENGVRLDERDSIQLQTLNESASESSAPAESCWIDGDLVVLMGSGPFNKALVSAQSIPKPAWVSVIPKGNYGRGISGFRRGAPGASWAVADENAIVSLGKNSFTGMTHSLKSSSSEYSYSAQGVKVSRERVDSELRNAVIVARWLDAESMTCFSLAHAERVENYVGGKK